MGASPCSSSVSLKQSAHLEIVTGHDWSVHACIRQASVNFMLHLRIHFYCKVVTTLRSLCCSQARTELPLEPGCYNLLTYLAYTLYPPLYIAGPIAPYNSFASQLQAPSTKLTLQSISLYAARAMFCLLTLEFVTHTLWFNAVAKHRLWASLAVAQGGVLSALDMTLVPWWVMLFVWLKFLVIWRFFRYYIFNKVTTLYRVDCAR